MPTLLRIPLAQLLPPPEPMRVTITDEMVAEKVESMRAVGQLVPLIVTPVMTLTSPGVPDPMVDGLVLFAHDGGLFEIIDGHCRFLAAPAVPLPALDCSVFLDVAEAKHAMMLHAGIIRQQFTAYEEGRQFVELSNKHGWTLEDLCRTFHRAEGYINDRVAIALAPEQVATAVQSRAINLAQAKQIIRAKDDTLRAYLLDQASVHGATARTLEVMRHNWSVENEPREDGAKLHTPDHAVPLEPAAPRVCCWCDQGEDIQNLTTVDVHWYHKRDLLAVVDQVGSKNLHRAQPVSSEAQSAEEDRQ